jgi:hypothetical protein
MSIRSTAFIPRSFEPHSTVTLSPASKSDAGSTVTALAAANEVAFEAAPATGSAAKDIILFWGPGHRKEDFDDIIAICSKLAVALKVVQVEGFHSFHDSLKKDLYLGGELGRQTQVIAFFHGGADIPGGRQYLQLSADGKEQMESIAFFCWLRSPPPGMPASPEQAGWKGIVHAFWCGSGKLRDDFLPGRPFWDSGTALSYAARKDTASDNAVKSVLDLCEFVSVAKADPSLLAPRPVAARMLGVVGDTFCCMGTGFEQAVVISAPRTSEEAQSGCLIDCLEGRSGQQARVAGAEQDLRAIAASMREPRIGSQDPKRYRTKLENVFVTRFARDKLAAMDKLLEQHEFLSSMRLRDGMSASDMREIVIAFHDVRQAVATLSAGRGDTSLLTAMLEQMLFLSLHGESIEIDLASMLSARPDLVSEGLRWGVMQDQASVFFRLLDARADCTDAQLADEFLPLALQHCAPVAMELLALAHEGATMTDCIVQGIRQGASARVLSAWLIKHRWYADISTMKTVLYELQEKCRLPVVLKALGAYAPQILEKALPVLATERQRFAQEASILLEFAKSTGNADLYWQVRKHFPAFVES